MSANVGNLSAGEHTVPIIINSPDSVTSTLSTKQAKVRVTAKKQSGTNDEQTDKETSGSTSDKETKPDTGTGSGTNPGTGNSGHLGDSDIQVIQLINQTKRLIHLKTIQIHQQIVQKLVTTVVIKVMKILHP